MPNGDKFRGSTDITSNAFPAVHVRITELWRRANNQNGVSIKDGTADTGRQFSFFVDTARAEGSIY